MKAQLLDKLVDGNPQYGLFLHLIFIRAVRVIAFSLVLTLIVYLLWHGKFTLGAFLGGAASGFLVFSTLGYLKRRLSNRELKEGSCRSDDPGNLADPEEVRPTTPVKD